MDIWYWILSYCLSTVILYCAVFVILRTPRREAIAAATVFAAVSLLGTAALAITNYFVGGLFDILIWLPTALAVATTILLLEKKKHTVLVAVVTLVFMIVQGMLLSLFYMAAGLPYNTNSFANIWLNLYSELLCAVVVVIIAIMRYSGRYKATVPLKINTSLLVFLGTGLLTLSLYIEPLVLISMQFSGAQRAQLFTGLLTSCVIFIVAYCINYFSLLRREVHDAEKRQFQLYIESQKQHYEQLLADDRKVRSIKHDMSAHLNCIAGHLQNGDDQRALRYTNTLLDEFGAVNNKRASGNPVVDMILGRLQSDSAEVQLHGLFPANLNLDDVDLCILVSNLLSNAIHATEQSGGGTVRFDVQHMDANLILRVSNPVAAGTVRFHKGLPVPKTAREGHGFGVKNIVAVVDKYKGSYQFSQKEDVFEVEIVLFGCITSAAH